jgi:thioredoxin reductase (NADPH)
MAPQKPIILFVDDEPQVLNAVERDLRRHFRGEYRIVKAGSGAEALDATRRLAAAAAPVALFLADQRMPEMTGTQFLAEARKLYPKARKVLLTAYADTDAAIKSINEVGLDHYLMKPWDPPERHLYPVLDDLLGDWAATVPVPYDGIRVAGTQWSAASHQTKDFLARNRIPYLWLDIDRDAETRALVEALPDRGGALPVLFFPDGTVLVCPERRALAEKIGLQTQAAHPFYDLIVIGAGPAGLAAGVYGASEGLRTLMIEKEATGGQAGTSSRIENYLGFPSGLSGEDLARRATAQARRFGAEVLTPQEVTKLRVEPPYKIVTLGDGTELSSFALLIATGVSVSRLDVPGIEAVTGAGVYYGAALTEAAHYRGQDVFVVGGGNSAGQGAMFFAQYARKVTVLVRGPGLADSMSQYLIDQMAATPNIELRPFTKIAAVTGESRLETVVLADARTGETTEVAAAAVFVFIGAAPRTELAAGLVERNPGGFILTGSDVVRDGRRPAGWRAARDPLLLETSVEGIFAAGDVRSGSSKRVAAAVGEGAVAVQLVHQYLKTV